LELLPPTPSAVVVVADPDLVDQVVAVELILPYQVVNS
jgi:hypothetical protein